MSQEKPRRLGRGLEALLGAAAAPSRELREASAIRHATPATLVEGADNPLVDGAREHTGARGESRTIAIANIRANPYQPRRDFRPDELASLEGSLRANGLLQPVTVRPLAGDSQRFELVAGERRLRAAARLGWSEIPALVRVVDDRAMLTLALVENLQRADLNPIDEAVGVQRLIEEFGLSQQQVAEALGKDRSTITNLLRVLALPDGVRRLLQDGKLALGHARALLMVSDVRALLALARETVEEGLSVREVERRARAGSVLSSSKGGRSRKTKSGRPASTSSSASTAATKQAADALRRYLQTDVGISGDTSRGEVRLSFYSAEDLHRLMGLILRASWGSE